MFVRADQILIEQTEDTFPLHVLDFHWDGFEPHMVCRDVGSEEVSEFDLHDVGFSVSRKKICVGYFDDDGRYIPCPTNSVVSRFDQCQECSTESFIPHQECIFEPKCDGELCDLEFCRREHVLYVAFYDTTMKIGMSSSRRVERRLIEQGADAFSILGSFPTRKKAREAEKDISARMRIPQSHRQDSLLQSLVRPVDANAIEARHEALSASLGQAYGLSPEKLRFLDRYPIDLPLPQPPKLQDSWGSHRGSFIGIKGRWLVYDSKGLKAVNLSDLPARFVSRRELSTQ